MSSSQDPGDSGISTSDWLVVGVALLALGATVKKRYFKPQIQSPDSVQPIAYSEAPAQLQPVADEKPPEEHRSSMPSKDAGESASTDALETKLVADLEARGLAPVRDKTGKIIRDPKTNAVLTKEVKKEEGTKGPKPASASNTPTPLSAAEHRLMERLKADGFNKTLEAFESSKAKVSTGEVTKTEKATNTETKKDVQAATAQSNSGFQDSGWSDSSPAATSSSDKIPHKDDLTRKDVVVDGKTISLYTCTAAISDDECAALMAKRQAEDDAKQARQSSPTAPLWRDSPSYGSSPVASYTPPPSDSQRASKPISKPRIEINEGRPAERRLATEPSHQPQRQPLFNPPKAAQPPVPAPPPHSPSGRTPAQCASFGGATCSSVATDLRAEGISPGLRTMAIAPGFQLGSGGNLSGIDFSGRPHSTQPPDFVAPNRSQSCKSKLDTPYERGQAQDPKKFPPAVQALYAQLAVKDKKRAQDLLLNNQKAACELGVNPSTGDAASCYDDPPGAACNCQEAFNQRYSVGAIGSAADSYAKMWKDLRHSSTNRDLQVIDKAFENDPVNKALLLSYLETICTGDKCPAGGAGVFRAVAGTSDRPDLSMMRNFEANRILSASLNLNGSANVLNGYPPVCAAVNPVGTAELMNQHGLTGLEDSCHQLSSNDPARMSELDHFEILSTISFATELGAEVDTRLRNALPTPSFVDETRALVDTVELQKGFSYRDYRPQSATQFPTVSKLAGIYRNLLQCKTPGQLGWAFREAEKDMRRLAIDWCGSKEAAGFASSFGSEEQRQAFVAPFRSLGGKPNANLSKGERPGVDFTRTGEPQIGDLKQVQFSDCNNYSIRGNISGTMTYKPNPIGALFTGATDCPGDENRNDRADAYINAKDRSSSESLQGWQDFNQQMQGYYANSVFAEITKQVPISYIPSTAPGPIEGIGLLKGSQFRDCTELLNAHRVMMYLIMDRNGYANGNTPNRQHRASMPNDQAMPGAFPTEQSGHRR